MSVTEYAAKFVELAKFYPHYTPETAEFSKCIKFENGLPAEIKRSIGYQKIRIFSELVSSCRIYEEETKAHYKALNERKGKGQQSRPKPYSAPVDKGCCIPYDDEMKKMILEESHRSSLSIHPGATKMYHDLKKLFWWFGMKRDVAQFVYSCLVCQKSKVEHQKPAGLMTPLDVPEWKWDSISMDFVTSLSNTPRGNDAIWVIVLSESSLQFHGNDPGDHISYISWISLHNAPRLHLPFVTINKRMPAIILSESLSTIRFL